MVFVSFSTCERDGAEATRLVVLGRGRLISETGAGTSPAARAASGVLVRTPETAHLRLGPGAPS